MAEEEAEVAMARQLECRLVRVLAWGWLLAAARLGWRFNATHCCGEYELECSMSESRPRLRERLAGLPVFPDLIDGG